MLSFVQKSDWLIYTQCPESAIYFPNPRVTTCRFWTTVPIKWLKDGSIRFYISEGEHTFSIDMAAKRVVSVVAASLVSLLQIPQVYKTLQTKDTSGLSYGSLALHTVNSCLWFTYGLILGEIPMLTANVSYLIANVTLISMKLIYEKNSTHESDVGDNL